MQSMSLPNLPDCIVLVAEKRESCGLALHCVTDCIRILGFRPGLSVWSCSTRGRCNELPKIPRCFAVCLQCKCLDLDRWKSVGFESHLPYSLLPEQPSVSGLRFGLSPAPQFRQMIGLALIRRSCVSLGSAEQRAVFHKCALGCLYRVGTCRIMRQAIPRDKLVAQLLNVTATLSISRGCLLYSCVCAAVQQSEPDCVLRAGLCVDSLCSQLSSFSRPPAPKEGGVGLLSLELCIRMHTVPSSQKGRLC